jgi:CHASE2 domain-containing sensor protein
MKKFKKSMISDFRLGIALTLAALFIFFFFWGHLEKLEYGLYDISARLRVKPFVAPVSVIAIDEQSLANFGRWP